jgi:outer membrane protein assembly factor BamD (BamD/ComL family)
MHTSRKTVILCWIIMGCFTLRCPAPLIFTPGEGWSYETPGTAGDWMRDRASEQLEVAQQKHDEGDFKTGLKASKRLIRQWPFSDYAPDAQYLAGLCYEGMNKDEKAFQEYQRLLQEYPTSDRFEECLTRQFEITTRYLDGKRFRIWGLIPLYRSMGKTSEMYQEVIDNGPFSEVASQAQMNIGQAMENDKDFAKAVKAYEKAADKYNKNPEVVADALFKTGLALMKDAKAAEYDQGMAIKAIDVFTDFIALFPTEERVNQANQFIDDLRIEQARGSLVVARFYDKKDLMDGAMTYYNDVVDILNRLLNAPEHPYAVEARERLSELRNDPRVNHSQVGSEAQEPQS